jgi:tripartite-type tricarboxylate transporter receptor subunit TctC
VIIQNMPGANSVIAANHLYNVAKPDGLTIGTFNRNLPLGQLIKAEGVRFDATKFAWIGSASSEATVLTIRSDLPYKTFEDLQNAKEPVIIGATGPGASTHDFPLLLKEYLGANLKVLSGYKSSSDIMLAIERKEVDGRAGSFASVKPWVDRGLVRPLVRTRGVEPGIEQLPADEALAGSPLAKAVFALRSIPEVIGRPYVAPPGTPDELVQTLREAFAGLARDPEAIAEAKKLKFSFDYIPGDEALKIVREIFAQPEEVVREFTKHVKFGD